jgi:hypothetical protein
MAVVNTLSTVLTNRDATPVTLSNPTVNDGLVRSSVGQVSIGLADSSTSTYRFISIPSNARIIGLNISTDAAAGGSCAGTLGLYDTTANGSAGVASHDQFGTAIDLHTAALTKSNQMFHSGAATNGLTIANASKAVWSFLALSSDPNKFYDIVLTLTADNSTNAVACVLQVDYVV